MLNEEIPILASQSLAADVVSTAQNIKDVSSYGIQIATTGTPNGLFKLQVSLDEGSPRGESAVNWDDLENSQVYVNQAGSHTWNVNEAMYNWVRLIYTRVSGTGALSARFIKKREN